MSRKGAIGVSTNAIITIVIAVVVLIALLALITQWFDKVDIPAPDLPVPQPTSADPVTMAGSSITADRGDTIERRFAVLNGPNPQSVSLAVECQGKLSDVQINAQDLEANQAGEFLVLMTVADTAASGDTLCSATAAGIGRTEFRLTVQ